MTKSLIKFETMVILLRMTAQPGPVSMQQVSTRRIPMHVIYRPQQLIL